MTDRQAFNTRRYETNPPHFARFTAIVDYVPQGSHVLELGAGDGSLGDRLIREKTCTYIGFDLSDRCVAKARELGRDVRQLDIEDAELDSGEAPDVVVAAELIEHILDTGAFLRRIHRVLKPDGHIVLTTPNLASLGRRLLLFLGRDPLTEVAWDLTGSEAGHVRYFVRATLTALVEKNGFEITDFCSDRVNFGNLGSSARMHWLARLCPSIGQSLILKAKKR